MQFAQPTLNRFISVVERSEAVTYYVPVENRKAPAGSPQRWFFLMVDTTSPQGAMLEAMRIVDEELKLTKSTVVWAAVRDCPTFEYMQQLRDAFGKYSKAGTKRVPGYA